MGIHPARAVRALGERALSSCARHVDDLCFIHLLQTEGVAHGPATLFPHCGATNFVRPSLGAWVSYRLGTENANLPAFVTLSPSLGNDGGNWGTALLPPIHQGKPFGVAGPTAKDLTLRNLPAPDADPAERRRQFELFRDLNAAQLRVRPGDAELETVIASNELAWRMQGHAPAVLDLAG